MDQAALTGESFPVTVYSGGKVKMGSSVVRNEGHVVVYATGKVRGWRRAAFFLHVSARTNDTPGPAQDTFFGRAAQLINVASPQGRFQKILFKVRAAWRSAGNASAQQQLCAHPPLMPAGCVRSRSRC